MKKKASPWVEWECSLQSVLLLLGIIMRALLNKGKMEMIIAQHRSGVKHMLDWV